MRKLLVLSSCLWFVYTTQTFGQKKRQWEFGAGLDAYRCELNNVSHEKTGTTLLMGTDFTQDKYTMPLSYALYVRTSPIRTLPQFKVQLGFGVWTHKSVIHFDGWDIAAGPYWPVYTKADLNFRITYWHIPLLLQYQYALAPNSSLLFMAGATLGIRKEVFDNYNDIHNSLLLIGADVNHNNKKMIQPQLGVGYQYRYKRHGLSLSPFVRLGSYKFAPERDHYSAFYHNVKDARWRTPYGISLQYFYSLSKV